MSALDLHLRVEVTVSPLLASLVERFLLLGRAPATPLVPAPPEAATPAEPIAVAPLSEPSAITKHVASPRTKPRQRERARLLTGSPLWSVERIALLARLWPEGHTPEDIAGQVNALDGPELTARQVSKKASNEGFRRPVAGAEPPVESPAPEAVTLEQAPEPAPADPAPAPIREVAPAALSDMEAHRDVLRKIAPVPATLPAAPPLQPYPVRVQATPAAPRDVGPVRAAAYGVIEQWAIENGIGSPTRGFNLVEVNALRAKHGLHPWSIFKTGARP